MGYSRYVLAIEVDVSTTVAVDHSKLRIRYLHPTNSTEYTTLRSLPRETVRVRNQAMPEKRERNIIIPAA